MDSFVQEMYSKAAHGHDAERQHPAQAEDSALGIRITMCELFATAHNCPIVTPGPLILLSPLLPGMISICRGIRSFSAAM